MGYSKAVGCITPNYAEKNWEKWAAIKKLFVSAIFNPEYSEFFIDKFYTNLSNILGACPNEFGFIDRTKDLSITILIPNCTDFICHKYIRDAFAQTIVEVLYNGRMCDILYLINADSYNTLKNSIVYGVRDETVYMSSDLFCPQDIAQMFNINSFGNGKYILSLIQ